jgi:ribose transport system ATP-binding protein
MTRSIRENIVLAHMDKCRRFALAPLPSRQRELEVTREQISQLRVATRGPAERVGTLSGGNQQKVLLGRWLMDKDLRVLMLDEPTKGIDVGAKAELFRILETLARDGVAVVLVSSDLEEIADHADRVVVMVEGAAVAELDGTATESQMLSICYQYERVAPRS